MWLRIFDGSIRPRRTVRSDCRFARSTTYTRPTDVFLPQRQTGDCSSSGFWTIGPLASSKFFPRISEGFVFRSKLLETFASRFERNLTHGFVWDSISRANATTIWGKWLLFFCQTSGRKKDGSKLVWSLINWRGF